PTPCATSTATPGSSRAHSRDREGRRLTVGSVSVPADETAAGRGEKALPAVLGILEGQLAKNKWLLGSQFSLVDCAYCPILNVIEKAGFSFAGFPKVETYLDTCRARPTWKVTPKLPML